MKRDTSEYRAWVLNVKKAAGYRCKFCNSDKNLHAHHILPFKNFKNFATDISNGICLCAKCHGIIHGGKYKWTK